MNLQAKRQKKSLESIYIHVPFCGTLCDFCAFYQEKPHRNDINRYLEGIKKEIDFFLPEGPIETFFWGGGTPGLLMAKDMEVIGTTILNKTKQKPIEWTVEMAPATVKKDKLLIMKELGVTRISMGIQSFNKTMLEALGRIHSPQQVYKAYDLIREVGFQNVNLDLMFALPNQDMAIWEADMKEAIRLNPEHLSTYCLTFEEDTALYVKLSKGKITRNEENERLMYERTWEFLENAGYKQYEISNFAKQDHKCLHNINTWKMKDWLGIGPSASSQYNNKRFTNIHNLNEWLIGIENNSPKYIDEFSLDEETLALDFIIFGIRMNDGVNLDDFKVCFPNVSSKKYLDLFKSLETEKLGTFECNTLKLTKEGRLLVDKIGSELMDIK